MHSRSTFPILLRPKRKQRQRISKDREKSSQSGTLLGTSPLTQDLGRRYRQHRQFPVMFP